MSSILRLLATALCALVLAACASAPRAREAGGLILGITAPTDYEAAARSSGALGELFATALGAPVEVRLYDRYEQLVEAIREGEVDLAWLPPLSYVQAREGRKLLALRRATHGGALTYRSVLIARTDRGYTGAAALQGARVAWVSEASASGYLWPRAMLLGLGLSPERLFVEQAFVGNHEAVCLSVFDGTVDAGAVFTDEAALARGEISACSALLAGQPGALAIVLGSEPMPSEVVAAREGLPEVLAASAAAALDRLPSAPGGPALLQALFGADGFAPDAPADFGAVERARKLLDEARATGR